MQFTPRETKLIERLRNQQLQWPVARLLVLCSGLLLAGLCACLLFAEIHHYREVSRLNQRITSQIEKLPPDVIARRILEALPSWRDQVVEVAIFVPIWLVFALLALSRLLIVATQWRGDAYHVLLLKLANTQQRRAARDPCDD